MMHIQAKSKGCVVEIDILQSGTMHVIDGEELTPLEISKLALFYSLNLDCNNDTKIKENINDDR